MGTQATTVCLQATAVMPRCRIAQELGGMACDIDSLNITGSGQGSRMEWEWTPIRMEWCHNDVETLNDVETVDGRHGHVFLL
jgi:hypothetical protein